MKNKAIAFVVFSAIVTVILFFLEIKNAHFIWDDTDYIEVARKGFKANYLDEGSLDLQKFYQLSMIKKSKDDHKLDEFITSLPEEQESLFLLRHFHPALPVYFWTIFTTDEFSSTDNLINISKIISMMFFVILILWVVVKIIEKEILPNYLSLILIPLLFTSNLFLTSFLTINFHVFFSIALVFFAYSVYVCFESGKDKNSMLLALSLALLYACLETWIVVVGFAMLGFILFARFYELKRILVKVTAWFVFFILLIWPGALKTGFNMNAYFMYLYRILFKENKEYSDGSSLDHWLRLVKTDPALFIIISIALVLLLLRWKTIQAEVKILFFVGVGFTAAMTPFIITDTYILPGVVLLFVISCILISKEISLLGVGVPHINKVLWGMVGVVFFIQLYFYFGGLGNKIQRYKAEKNEMIFLATKLKKDCLRYNKEVFIEDANVFNYYANTHLFKGVSAEFKKYLTTRERYRLVTINKNRLSQSIHVVFKKGMVPVQTDQYLRNQGFEKKKYLEWVVYSNRSILN